MAGTRVRDAAKVARGRPARQGGREPQSTAAAELPAEQREEIVERPDGSFWVTGDSGREVGPFASRADALAAMRAADESPLEPGETVDEAKAELGIADWIDPDTGEPAEEEGPRTEEH